MASSSSSNVENASTIKKNNNPNGKNQYQGRPPRDDPYVEELLRKYHREGITDRRELSKRFLSDHGILMSERTVARWKGRLGLFSSRLTTMKLSEDEKRQLILDQMSKDPKGRIGPRTVKKGIFEDTGISLTRDYIIEAMRTLDPQAYDARSPHHAREKRKKKLLKEARQISLGDGQNGDDSSGGAASRPPPDPGPSSNGQRYGDQAPSTSQELDHEMESATSQGSGPSPPRELELNFEQHDFTSDPGPSSSSTSFDPPRTIHLTERPQVQLQPTRNGNGNAMQLPRIAQLQLSSSGSRSGRPRASTNAHRGSTTSAAVASSTSGGPTDGRNATAASRSGPNALPRVPPTAPTLPLPNPLPAPSNPYANSLNGAQITPSTFTNYTLPLPPLTQPSSFIPPSSNTLPSQTSPSSQPSSSTQPNPTSILTSLRETTPLITSLTRFLQSQSQDPTQATLTGDEAREVLGEAMKCMEAAALLERQIARFAGGLKGALG